MGTGGYDVREEDPFDEPTAIRFNTRDHSPYVNRVKLMWQDMRDEVIKRFPEANLLISNEMNSNVFKGERVWNWRED